MTACTHSFPSSSPQQLHAPFLVLLPRLQTHARIAFANCPCPARKADAIQETIALAWKWFVRLAEQGKDVNQFPCVFAGLLTRAVRSGRRLCGQEKAKDAMSPVAQQRHHFHVEALASATRSSHEQLYARPRGQQVQDAFEERLQDNLQTPVPDQVAFRMDFRAWRRTWSDRDRRIMDDLLAGERTQDVSRKYGISPARVSQKRRQFHQDWLRFHGELQAPA